MNKKFGFIKELNIKNIMGKIFMSVLAEEVDPNTINTTDPTNTPNPTDPIVDEPKKVTVNFEDMVARARKEEKDKLYPQIKKLQGENDSLTEKNNNHLLTIESKDSEIEDLKGQLEEAKNSTSKSDDDVVKGLKKEAKAYEATIKKLEKEIADMGDVEEKVKGEYEVKLYRSDKLRDAGKEIIPELVTGVTKEDIDASFEVATQRYKDIARGIVSTATSTIPLNNADTGKFNPKDFKAEDIANMSPAEWAEKRKLLGLK